MVPSPDSGSLRLQSGGEKRISLSDSRLSALAANDRDGSVVGFQTASNKFMGRPFCADELTGVVHG